MTEEEKAALEAANGLRQFDYAVEAIQSYLEPERPFALRPTLVRTLRALAVEGLEAEPDRTRSGVVSRKWWKFEGGVISG